MSCSKDRLLKPANNFIFKKQGHVSWYKQVTKLLTTMKNSAFFCQQETPTPSSHRTQPPSLQRLTSLPREVDYGDRYVRAVCHFRDLLQLCERVIEKWNLSCEADQHLNFWKHLDNIFVSQSSKTFRFPLSFVLDFCH